MNGIKYSDNVRKCQFYDKITNVAYLIYKFKMLKYNGSVKR